MKYWGKMNPSCNASQTARFRASLYLHTWYVIPLHDKCEQFDRLFLRVVDQPSVNEPENECTDANM
jgi:hypothetical protein